MNKLYRILLATAAIATLAGCNKYDEIEDTPEPGQGNTIKFYADVEGQENTRASITVGGSTFSGTWEDNDDMGILATIPGGTSSEKSEKFTYTTASSSFEGAPAWIEETAGAWKYYAFAPHVDVAKGTTKVSIPFGNARTQDGNKFNSKFDALVAKPREITNAAPGMDDAGKAIAFNLNRLTSILRFTTAGSKADKVKALLLTSENEATQPISAASLDFDAAQGASTTAALSTADASNVIAMTYSANAPAANGVEAFFNVPSGTYDKLTLEVITEDKQIGSVSVVRSTKPFVAGTLYTKAIADMTFAPIAAPSLDWPGQDMDIPHEIIDEDGDMVLDYPAAITINVPGGIAGLTVNIKSDVLNAMNLSTLDLFGEDLGLPGLTSGLVIQYKKSTIFDISLLVPLIAQLEAEPGSQHIFEVVVTDLAGQVTTQALTFEIPSLMIEYNNDADLWKNTASFNVKPTNAASNIGVEYKRSTESVWQQATIVANGDGTYKASIAPSWIDTTNEDGFASKKLDNKTGVFAGATYDYRLTIDGTEATTGQFTTAAGNTMTDGSLETSWKDGKQFVGGSSNYTFWGSGYNTFAPKLCTRDDTMPGRDGNYCAKLQASYNTMANIPAPGNLFTANFKISVNPMGGYVSFGKKYTYNARPSAVKVKVHAKIGDIDYNLYGGPIEVGQPDKGRVMVCIVNWTSQREVFAGKSAPENPWDPNKMTELDQGKIIGYASKFITSTIGDSMEEIEIPILYNDDTAAAPTAAYNIVINCSTSAYGDYMDACTTNTMYLDDFQWVY